MFSARLGFMRPNQGALEPDEPVLPPADPTVAGNLWFSTRYDGLLIPSYSKYEGHPFNNLITDNWMMATIVYGPPNGQDGFNRFNGLDLSYGFSNDPGRTLNILPAVSPKPGQPELKTFVIGVYEDQGKGTSGNQMGVPMYVRDFYIHNGPTSESDVEKIEGWMCHDAGLQDILQTDHAYRSAPPQGFSPSDLSPRAWWHSETNFDPTGTATWSTVDGAHTLVKDTLANNETIQSVTEDGINAIKFPNSKTSKKAPPFAGSKYRADSVALNSNIHYNGVTICILFKIYDMPGVYDQNTVPYANTSFFTLNTDGARDGYINGGFRPERDTENLPDQTAVTTDSAPDSGNTDVAPANVTTDGGNVSV